MIYLLEKMEKQKNLNPLVSIGITSYNAEETISKAINSALNQSWPNKEIIIVDDNSTDGSWQIIKNLSSEKTNFFFYKNRENKGVAFSRNVIINKSNGKYIVFFDDDDESHLNRIYLQFLEIELYRRSFSIRDPIFCYSKRNKIYKNKNKNINYDPPGINKKQLFGENVSNFLIRGKKKRKYLGSYASCTLMGLKKDFNYCECFDNEFRRCEDTEFAVRAGLKGAHFIGVNKILVIQQMTYGNYKNLSTELKFILKMLKKHRNIFNNKKEYESELIWVNIKYSLLTKKFYKFFSYIINLLLINPFYFFIKCIQVFQNITYNLKIFNNEN